VSGCAPAGSAVLRLRGQSVRLEPGRPLLMGVVNASPESFFDGGRLRGLEAQVEHALSLSEAGAALIDVGGESGVTDLPPVDAIEEARRLVPLVERLAGEGLLVSVDTWKADVARAALDAGAVLVNDVSGLSDPGVAGVCADSGAGLVITHTRGAPKTKAFPRYRDVVGDVTAFLRDRVALARESGVEEERLLLDPGPDLAKTPAETVEVLRALDRVRHLGRPVLLAVSRKDFVGAICHRPPSERLAGTLAAVGEGIDAGASVVRTHDVAAVADFLAVRAPLRGESDIPAHLHLEKGLRREESAA
jgi:dihydropteroate synthase